MKKTISIILICASIMVLLASCFKSEDKTTLRIGYMTGPTGMGFAKLINDNGGTEGNEKYSFSNYVNNTTNAMADLVARNVDIVSVPTNLAANFYNKNKNIVVLAVNCLNSLYVVTDKNNTVEDLHQLEGKTIYTCKSGTPKPILEYILQANGINATISTTFEGTEISEPKDVGALVTSGKLPIAVMPEPMVTSSILAIQKAGNDEIKYSVDIDLGEYWDAVFNTPVTMGCIVARADFVNENKEAISAFLDEYKSSINYVSNAKNLESASDYIVNSEIMAAKGAASKALSNLGDSISYLDGAEMKAALEAFYTAIGISSPENAFYYENKN